MNNKKGNPFIDHHPNDPVFHQHKNQKTLYGITKDLTDMINRKSSCHILS